MSGKTDNVSDATKVSDVIKAPDDGWSDDEFVMNLPPELLESGQAAVSHVFISCLEVCLYHIYAEQNIRNYRELCFSWS